MKAENWEFKTGELHRCWQLYSTLFCKDGFVKVEKSKKGTEQHVFIVSFTGFNGLDKKGAVGLALGPFSAIFYRKSCPFLFFKRAFVIRDSKLWVPAFFNFGKGERGDLFEKWFLLECHLIVRLNIRRLNEGLMKKIAFVCTIFIFLRII